jgi:serine/threonine protein kinase
MHRSKIVHRDIKPENIIKSGDIYKLTDFGFAITEEDIRNSPITNHVGTALYSSP